MKDTIFDLSSDLKGGPFESPNKIVAPANITINHK
jgi:hypothetical protein